MTPKTYKLGNTTVKIIPPEISEEERQKRLKAIEDTIRTLLINKYLKKDVI
ncbi:hypothetical protein [Thermoflavimicrobium dichotomicum]|uniref:Uncharacterized protein n=1 Tax=Thermoflavimicrobium dichotomicum TaxID=46223 RepID=A0A1I3UIT7_9BACL|nr:hypothetical protein [Thermoflavimicrobium dichotomicum]SFJ82609.1 hypothetical protein SAMN05421852_12513 [Thermoflavimicrobium dichotomicum]